MGLVVDGDYVFTSSSTLLPVMAGDAAAMLKISSDPQEQRIPGGPTVMDGEDLPGSHPFMCPRGWIA